MADQKRNVEFWRESDQKRKKKKTSTHNRKERKNGNRVLTKIETVFGLFFFAGNLWRWNNG